LEVYLKMMIECTQRYIPTLCLSEFGDAIGNQDGETSEIHFAAVIEQVQRCTWRPGSREISDTL
jgi:hypothetical protein